MKKLKLYYLMAKEWVLEKYYGSVYERFVVLGIAFILLFLLLLITT